MNEYYIINERIAAWEKKEKYDAWKWYPPADHIWQTWYEEGQVLRDEERKKLREEKALRMIGMKDLVIIREELSS